MYQVLKHLPQVAVFNIIGFGTNYVKLFPTSQPCIPKNIGVARRRILKHIFIITKVKK